MDAVTSLSEAPCIRVARTKGRMLPTVRRRPRGTTLLGRLRLRSGYPRLVTLFCIPLSFARGRF